MDDPIQFTLADPARDEATLRRRRQADRNSAWLQAHVAEIYSQHRGKCVCVAGEELFVADSPQEAVALAKAAHPDDRGALLRYIPRERTERIYAAARPVASVR